MPGVQAVGRPDRAHILGAEDLTLLDVFDDKERAPESAAGLFFIAVAEVYVAKSLLSGAHGVDHRLELFGFKGKRTVGTGRGARQSQVLFDDAGAECNRSHSSRDSKS